MQKKNPIENKSFNQPIGSNEDNAVCLKVQIRFKRKQFKATNKEFNQSEIVTERGFLSVLKASHNSGMQTNDTDHERLC